MLLNDSFLFVRAGNVHSSKARVLSTVANKSRSQSLGHVQNPLFHYQQNAIVNGLFTFLPPWKWNRKRSSSGDGSFFRFGKFTYENYNFLV